MARPKDLGLEHTWRLRLRREAASGLSIAAFCSREGVSSASFYPWRRRLATTLPTSRPTLVRSDPPRSEVPAFVVRSPRLRIEGPRTAPPAGRFSPIAFEMPAGTGE